MVFPDHPNKKKFICVFNVFPETKIKTLELVARVKFLSTRSYSARKAIIIKPSNHCVRLESYTFRSNLF